MNGEHISDALNLLDDDIILEADSVRKNNIRVKNMVAIITAIAACFAVVIFACVRISSHKLPLLEISGDNDTDYGWGYALYMTSDILDVNVNPWNEETAPDTLPVYVNQVALDDNFNMIACDFDTMKAFLKDVIEELGLDYDKLTITDDAEVRKQKITDKFGFSPPDGYYEPSTIIAIGDGIEITVDPVMLAEVTIDPTIFFSEKTASELQSDAKAFAEFFIDTYSELFDFENPKMTISQKYVEIFDKSGSITEQIINYNFNKAVFSYNSYDNIYTIKIYRTDLSQKVGNYPIISTDEAQNLLLNGNFISANLEMPTPENIVSVELIYRTEIQAKYYMPYYYFLVKLQNVPEETAYGAYFVPAVDGKYISNMPVYDILVNY